MKKNLIICCITLAGFVCNLGVASPATDYSFVREFGEEGPFSNQFYGMNGIAVDRFGHVFITDVLFSKPANNKLLVGEQNYVQVKRWSTDGQYQLMWGNNQEGFGPALGIDCSCDGDPFYVVPLRNAYAFIEQTKPDGNFLEVFPSSGWNLGYPFEFIDVAISADGYAFGTVKRTDMGSANILYSVAKFEWNGTDWDGVVSIDVSNAFGNISQVHGIDVNPWKNRVYVTIISNEGANAAINVYDMNLDFIESFEPWNYDAKPLGIAVDNRNGDFFVCEAVSNIIQKFTYDGAPVTSWGEYGSAQSQFDMPTDLDVDIEGYVYVADAGNSRVQVFAPPMEGNLNFIVQKSKTIVKWKTKLKGKNRDVIMAKGWVAVDHLTNIFGGPGSKALVDMPISFWYGEVPIINNMMPTKTNLKGSRALYKSDKEHKVKLIYKEKGAIIKFIAKLKKGDINETLGINDVEDSTLPQWLWIKAQMNLSTNYLGVHYMRLEHKNKVGKVYKAIKK